MDSIVKRLAERTSWLLFAVAAGFVSAALRRWQLSTAFEDVTGLAIPGAQASVILACVLVMSAAWFILSAIHQPMAKRPIHRNAGIFTCLCIPLRIDTQANA